MTSVMLQLPEEIIQELQLPYEGARDASAVTIAIEGIAVAANLATLLTAQPQLRAIVTAIRHWRLRDPRDSLTLTVRGPGIDLRVDLPRNLNTDRLLHQLEPLLEDEHKKGAHRRG